ncbi:MAG: hypothetical protein MZU95_05660 [Desulfomicrobium escambiense]|nr:hypothetical protein [Desulfomicrobium escambiense]
MVLGGIDEGLSGRQGHCPTDSPLRREHARLLASPYAVFPIRRGRSSGFTLPTLGQSGRDGKYLRRLGYYFGFSDYIDLQIRSDIMEKTRFSLSLQERHRLRYVHDGGFRVEWRREYENSRDRWMVNLGHMHELRDGTMLKLQGSFLSDRSYLEDTQGDPQERMNREAEKLLLPHQKALEGFAAGCGRCDQVSRHRPRHPREPAQGHGVNAGHTLFASLIPPLSGQGRYWTSSTGTLRCTTLLKGRSGRSTTGTTPG